MPDPQPVPINAKFDDDFVTQLIVVLTTVTMREVAIKVAQHVVGKRPLHISLLFSLRTR